MYKNGEVVRGVVHKAGSERRLDELPTPYGWPSGMVQESPVRTVLHL